ncbi:MAG: ABC transporter ATP-binding protein [Lachnospiraceae bacterium]|nr:ABC transporter ATP-binding protein [Lachnospiraceae bacterium]
MAVLSLEHIQKIYPNGFEAVKNFNLQIEEKEFVVLLGPSGCGKSTVLRMIAGLETISSGELKIDGQIMNNVDTKDREIAMIFKNAVLYPNMTVYDNLASGLRLCRLSKKEIDSRVRETAKFLELEDILDQKPEKLSEGQKQSVIRGRAIVRNSKIYLMDEALSNLEDNIKSQMYEEIQKIHEKQGDTILYVTENQAEAMALGDRIVVMKDGVIKQIGSPTELKENPANRFVAGYLFDMEFYDVKCVREGGNICIKTGTNTFPLSEKQAEKLKDYGGQTIYMGIRQSDLKKSTEKSGKKNNIAEIVFDISKVYLFDKDTEETLVLPED